ncbi:glycerol-3-phosphate dehydrogenase/oxidase [Pontibacter sp. HSC-36F09]|uniref:glycerol-3-phosphate dehydrogenase/oxidase n=1 Tax=Pontibacter sp. HSC-36F09 TaxID=2910966 RepID=UPI00209EF387|nr:glycerol-3-phosphate dehydrogenase/oxidase [Pontibacter sp. HSC-36F09]MCP2043426.1 glycerol-3-phosphate dehydrogenase [Pontibacter sp. HSC-36F09]
MAAIPFTREAMLRQLSDVPVWDVLVIGGGATGLGTALDAASRGYKTLLLEQSDFAKGTSSRSTKLVHGGVRYLAQGNIRLVFEALRERGLLLRNAPHVVSVQPFVILCYSWWQRFFYGTGLTLYDLLAGRYSLGRTAWWSRKTVLERMTNIKSENLKGGIVYYDGQFDDARLALNLAQTCAEQGATVLNYVRVTGLTKDAEGKVNGVEAVDLESGQPYTLRARAVVNATGVYVDEILQLDQPAQNPLVMPSQGVHVVLNKSFLPGDAALMIPKTPDGRVLFAIPWQEHVLVGTTDTPLQQLSLEPVALDTEINFILQTAGAYLQKSPTRQDVLSVFAGLRPLAAPSSLTGSTKEISRSHKLLVAPSGLITITGGKWTTYRQMAEDTVNAAIRVAGLPAIPCRTERLPIHGAIPSLPIPVPNDPGGFAIYSSDATALQALMQSEPELAHKLHPDFSYTLAEVVWAVRYEMARSVEDVLARRLRVLFLDARAAQEMAPVVAEVMALELNREEVWQREQTAAFEMLVKHYLPQATEKPAVRSH